MYELISFLKNIIYIILAMVVLMAIFLYFNQNKMIYMPEVQNMCTNDISANPKGFRNPKEVGMEYKEIRINTEDNVKLYGWFIHHKESLTHRHPTFIYFHENAGNIGFRMPFCELLHKKLKLNVLIMGYRGYGYSEGVPSEEGLMLDSEAIIDYVFNKETEISKFIDKSNVYIFGRSLGGAVAIYVAEKLKPDIRGLIIENTFSSMGDMVDHLFPLFKHIKGLLLANKWPSKVRIQNLKYPMMFFQSDSDELVPHKHMQTLYSLASNVTYKQKFVIVGGTHNESWHKNPTMYSEQLITFMEKCSNSISSGEPNLPLEENEEGDDEKDNLEVGEFNSINKEEESYLVAKKVD